MLNPEGATQAELAWASAEKASFGRQYQYFALQAYDPRTVSYGMMDSPVGQAAWVLDKFVLWSDRRASADGFPFDLDRALTEIMIYILGETFYSAATMYRAMANEGPLALTEGQRIEPPVGYAAFPDQHCPAPPAEFIRRSHNLVRYSTMPAGGHFPALEQPAVLLEDIQAFISEVSSTG